MSPTQFDLPLWAGSARHEACFCPSFSTSVASHSCGYSAFTNRTGPSSPRRTSSRACFTTGYPVYVYVTQKSRSFCRASPRSSSASFTSNTSGLSQTTWIPRVRKALAAAWWDAFGVTITAKSMRSFRLDSASAISSKDRYSRSSGRPSARPMARVPSKDREKHPAVREALPSSAMAFRWTSPMKAPGPPPTMPYRSERPDPWAEPSIMCVPPGARGGDGPAAAANLAAPG